MRTLLCCCVALTLTCVDAPQALELVRDARPLAIIVARDPAPAPARARRQNADSDTDLAAARVLAEWVKKITGADLPIASAAPDNAPAIYIGDAALNAGLKLDDIHSETSEGIRILIDDHRILLAGQSPAATTRAVCRLLEHLGCRCFMDGPLGEIYPQSRDLAVAPLTLTEKPALACRRIWGSNWTRPSLWKTWNGAGGYTAGTQHAWGYYLSPSVFDQHPEYFALRDAQRRRGEWYCTSNPDLRHAFAEGVIRAIADGNPSPSISPPDGRGYCQCDPCRAQDDPQSIEPSSNTVSVTNRYVDFFNDVARRVAAAHPNAILNFYAYADYTQPPTRGLKLEPNLRVWLAPIRYCRLHAIGAPDCPSRLQLQQALDGWAAASKRIAYRTYNFNLAECFAPVSLLSVWRHDIPYLSSHGCDGINLETLASWHIYGPHIYLSIRLAYDPAADAAAILDDYFDKFYGPAAAPMRDYWMGIDAAFTRLRCHSGGFHSLPLVYTPQFLLLCRQRLDDADRLAKADDRVLARIALCRQGLLNAAGYRELFDSVNAARFVEARDLAQRLLARADEQVRAGYANHYTADYFRRFIARRLDSAAAAAAPPARILAVLPDRWRMTYDDDDRGLDHNFAANAFDDSAWPTVLTFSRTLDAQGIPDRLTILWYRNTLEVPAEHARLSLLLYHVDGIPRVFVNGREAPLDSSRDTACIADITALVRPGQNTLAIRVDHRKLTELFAGGIVGPVALIDHPQP